MSHSRFLTAGVFSLLISSATFAQDLKPFVLPWNDTSETITDLSKLSSVPAGKYGYIQIDKNGHFIEGSQRIRFLGVNCVGTSCFPSKEIADVIAGRMAKFGINSVRFHHMDANWGMDNLIDYKAGGSSQISPDRLDRLHYFISKLKEHGIYSNINLLVSRNFQPEDGLPPETKSMEWKEKHIIGLFNDRMLELEKKYARELLTAKNPYTGLSLAEDPSVVIVEIMNENGIIHEWMGGKLDALPEVFKNELREKWNEWLMHKYSTTEKVIKSWNLMIIPLGENLLKNGDFSDGPKNWFFEKHHNSVANFVPTENEAGRKALSIEVVTPGTESWHVQINQNGLSFSSGEIYTISFWAKATSDVEIFSALQNSKDYRVRDFQQHFPASTEWKEFSQTFRASSDEKNVRLNIGGFGNKAVKVWLSDVRFQKGGKLGNLPEGASLEKKNLPSIAYKMRMSNPEEMRKDWILFLADLEKKYWGGMKNFVKNDLGYKGIVIGTIIANSPPNIQSEMDAVDSHAYWAHPSFPGRPWDPNNWFIETRAMVDAPQSSTIKGLSADRVKGKPFTVTEYQHASPNIYSAEGPIFVGAYGAFQDWDGIWMFDYGSGKDAWGKSVISTFFDMNPHPTKMANMLIAACMFRRFDVETGREEISYPMAPAKEIDVMDKVGHAWDVASATKLGMPFWIPLTKRISLTVGADASGSIPTFDESIKQQKVFASDTKQIRWSVENSSGLMTVDTPRTKALVGTLQGEWKWEGISITPTSPSQWLTAGICLTEGANFTNPQGWKGFAIFSGRVENTGMVWKNEKKNFLGTNWGKAPTLAEFIPLELKIPVDAKRVTIYSLDEKGGRKNPVPVTGTSQQAVAALGNGNSGSIWYEISVAPEK